MAITATRHCLTGCAIGEITGMVLSTWWGWGNSAAIALSVALAFVFGYALTYLGVRRMGADSTTAFQAALASDTVSILGSARPSSGPAWPSRWRSRSSRRYP
jgi:hypothetical protein